MRSFSAFLLVSSLFLLVTIAAAARPAVSVHPVESPEAGGWTPIKNVSDPHVQEIGRFAVAEYDKETKARLAFDKVVRGEKQVVAGVNYRLILRANGPANGGGGGGIEMAAYEATVWEKLDGSRHLSAFMPIND